MFSSGGGTLLLSRMCRRTYYTLLRYQVSFDVLGHDSRKGLPAQRSHALLWEASCARMRCQRYQPSYSFLSLRWNERQVLLRGAKCILPEEHSQRRGRCPRLVLPLLVLRPNELRLSTDADQNRSAGPLERGDYRFDLEDRDIQPCSACDAMQFHIHHVVKADLFPGTHSHPLSVRGPPSDRNNPCRYKVVCWFSDSVSTCFIAYMAEYLAGTNYKASSVSASILVASCSPTSCFSVS